MQDVAVRERWNDAPPIQAITVDLADGRPSRVEIRPDFLRANDANRRRQQCVERALKLQSGKWRLSSEASYLPERMHSCIGSSRPVQNDAFLRQPLQHADNLALDGRLVRLNLPAVKIRAVVRNRQLEVAHATKSFGLPDYERL